MYSARISTKAKFLFFFIVVLLIVFALVLLPGCVGEFTSQSIDSEELEAAPEEEVVLVAVGDVMLSRKVGELISFRDDAKAPFLETADILTEADIAFGNLESPFYEEEPPVEGELVFGVAAESVEGLAYAGFDIVSLANNHFGNQGTEGMLFTMEHLKDNGIEYTGAGESEAEAREATVIERGGVKFAFLGYNDVESAVKQGYAADKDEPGFAVLTEKNLTDDIKRAKEQAHVVIVSIHWGMEYEELPTERQRALAHIAIDSGAALVLGHHPHVAQPVRKYNGGYIFYSLGNFVFDQTWSEKTRKGLMAQVFFKGDEVKEVDIIKVYINDFYQPCSGGW